MINYRRLAEESLSRSQLNHSQSWPSVSLRTPAQPRWRSGLVGMALVFAPRPTSTVQPNDPDREKHLQGMGRGLFRTSGTEHGTFHKTANELHKQEEIMRRGGGVQIDEEPHVERVPISYKKNAELNNAGILLVARSEWAAPQRKIVRFEHASGLVARSAWLSTPVHNLSAGSVRIASQ